MSKSPIINIEHRSYAAPSISVATQLLNLLSKLKPVERKYSSDYSKSWYEPEENENLDVELRLNQEVKQRPKLLGLPKPSKRTVRCSCGHSDVALGQNCPSCGGSYFDS